MTLDPVVIRVQEVTRVLLVPWGHRGSLVQRAHKVLRVSLGPAAILAHAAILAPKASKASLGQ